MKIRFDFTVKFEDSDLLNTVNNFQDDYDLDNFNEISECPIELIVMALDYFEVLSSSYYDQYYENVNLTIEN